MPENDIEEADIFWKTWTRWTGLLLYEIPSMSEVYIVLGRHYRYSKHIYAQSHPLILWSNIHTHFLNTKGTLPLILLFWLFEYFLYTTVHRRLCTYGFYVIGFYLLYCLNAVFSLHKQNKCTLFRIYFHYEIQWTFTEHIVRHHSILFAVR